MSWFDDWSWAAEAPVDWNTWSIPLGLDTSVPAALVFDFARVLPGCDVVAVLSMVGHGDGFVSVKLGDQEIFRPRTPASAIYMTDYAPLVFAPHEFSCFVDGPGSIVMTVRGGRRVKGSV